MALLAAMVLSIPTLLGLFLGSDACHKSDNIEFRLWQPLPPFVFDEDGNRLHGNEQCGVKVDYAVCYLNGCKEKEDHSMGPEEGVPLCKDLFCFGGFCRTKKDILELKNVLFRPAESAKAEEVFTKRHTLLRTHAVILLL